MSRSAIYTTNTTGQTIAAGNMIPVGVTARRYGCNLKQDGNAITMAGQGYYLIDVSATVTPAAAGTVSLTARKDGVDIIGAIASETVAAAATETNLHITTIARNVCGCESSILSFVLTGGEADVDNMAVTVVKL